MFGKPRATEVRLALPAAALLMIGAQAGAWARNTGSVVSSPAPVPAGLLAPAAAPATSQGLTVATDKPVYGIFDLVRITAKGPASFPVGGVIEFGQDVVTNLTLEETSPGVYFASWDVPYDAPQGTYTVSVAVGGWEAAPGRPDRTLAQEATTTFDVSRPSVEYPCATPAVETQYADFAQGTRNNVRILSPDPDGQDDGALEIGQEPGAAAKGPDSNLPQTRAVIQEGEYISKEFNFFSYKTISNPLVMADVPPTSTLEVMARSRYDDSVDWGDWVPFQQPTDVVSPGQYFQYKILMTLDPIGRSPIVHSARFCLDDYSPPTPSPTQSPTPTESATPTPSPTLPLPSSTPTTSPSPTPSPTLTPAPTPPPTATPTPTESMTPTPAPSPTDVSGRVVFDFISDLEPGWVYKYAPPLTIPTSSTLATPPGFLRIQATDNRMNFGFWESPEVILERTDTQLDGVDPNAVYLETLGATNPAALLVKYRVFSDQTDPRTCPQLRLRTTGGDFQQSDLLVAFSSLGGEFSPTPAGRDYALLFFPNPSQDRFRFQFDMLNFDKNDAANGILDLDRVEISLVDPESQPNLVRDAQVTFAGGPGCWEQQTAPGIFDAPVFGYDPDDAGALTLSPGGSAKAYGYWSSRCPLTCLDPTRTYYVRFRVRTSVDVERSERVPSFRCRVNETGFQGCAYTHYTSKGTADRMPTPQTTDYFVAFQPDAAMESRGLLVSFDLLSFDANDDLDAILYLDQVDVYSAPQRY